MALSFAPRASSLEHLNIKFMARNDMSYKFYFHKLHKSCRKGKGPPTISHQAYIQNPNLCVVKTLDEYISRTEGWRPGEECSQLLLSFVDPHKLVVSSTVSGWLKKVLKKARIDISTFKAYSARSASTSKEDLSGAPIEEILRQWFSKCTWQKFYNKSIIQEDQLFHEMVFK